MLKGAGKLNNSVSLTPQRGWGRLNPSSVVTKGGLMCIYTASFQSALQLGYEVSSLTPEGYIHTSYW